MSAKLEVMLCIGGARFKTYDEVELVMKNGRVLKGTILPINSTRSFYLSTKKCVEVIYPEDIKNCVNVSSQTKPPYEG